MKFNQKLIELRKKEGLSQEELGYKLNVTRQTVSKWELNQTTPEMDKLVEMSKIFHISVDELINESEVAANQNPILEDQPRKKEKNKHHKKILPIVIGVLIIVVIAIVLRIFIVNKTFDFFNKTVEKGEDATNKAFELFDKATNMINQTSDEQNGDMKNEFFDVLDRVKNTIE